MTSFRRWLRRGFERLEGLTERVFTPAWNPLHNLGALGFFFYWIVAVSGIYLFIFFDTSVVLTYQSVEYLTVEQWYLGGVMRSFHRYASDAMVVVVLTHLLREFAIDRYRGARWFSWLTGVPILWLLYASGVSGYWLVWDKLAQYVAIAAVEWLDWLPIFGEPIARNFLTASSLNDRFFTLLVFLHIAVPLILLLVMWIHLQRMTRPNVNPPVGLAAGSMGMMLALAIAYPALSQGPADLTVVPAVVRLDWFYLALFPLFDLWSYGSVWLLVSLATVVMAAMPWLPPFRRQPAAVVDLGHCNGCGQCVDDCPYQAVRLVARGDGRPFSHEAQVNPALCTSCGLCVAACPVSTPFRRVGDLVTGIDLPHRSLKHMRGEVDAAVKACATQPRVMVFGCERAVDVAALRGDGVAALSLPCIGALAPSFIDYVLSRHPVAGVMLTGCRDGGCYHRLGAAWTEQRIIGERDPRLRRRVPRERLAVVWAASTDAADLRREAAAFAARVGALGGSGGAAAEQRSTAGMQA